MASTEDDFWNESSTSQNVFNFFDEDDDTAFPETDIFNSVVQESTILPIHSVISNKCLKIILDDINSTVDPVVPPPKETIRKMFHGENIILNMYKTLEDKLLLLDSALEISDGNIILAVILFLRKSLKPNVFLNQLLKRKTAVKHYANYLVERNYLQELADLYMASGNVFNLKDIYYLLSKDSTSQSALYKKLEQFKVHHAQNLYSTDDKLEIEENMSFLDVQTKYKCTDWCSVIDMLMAICETEWSKGSGDEVISQLKKQFKLDDFQYDWVVMSVLCKMKNWDKLVASFTKTVWVTRKRALKSTIRPAVFVVGISRYNPPKNIIEQFLSCTGDFSRNFYLAEKFKVHSYIINYYIEQKDRSALLKYMEKIEPGDEAMHAVHSALGNSDIKWKN